MSEYLDRWECDLCGRYHTKTKRDVVVSAKRFL